MNNNAVTTDNMSLLSSLMYLSVELKKADFNKSSVMINKARKMFFKDLEDRKQLTGDLAEINSLLSYLDCADPKEIKQLLRQIEPRNDNKF